MTMRDSEVGPVTTPNRIAGVFATPAPVSGAVPCPLVLAPLAGYSDLPFRLLCREQGAALAFTEMISSHGLAQDQEKTRLMLASVPADRPLVVQLFGAVPEIMAEAAARVCGLMGDGVAGIDLNMGCPVRKVTKRGAGAALMTRPDLAEAVIRAVVRAARAARPGKVPPVSVKIRSGKDAAHQNAAAFAQMAEAAGASLVSVHGRTWAQAFGGEADWQAVRKVKAAVGIPVIGNGDVTNFAQARARLLESGCDAVMIGRGALGNPWLFAGRERPMNLAGRLPLIRRYLELCEEHLDTARALFRIKNQVCRLLSGLPAAAALRQAVLGAGAALEIGRTLEEAGRPPSPHGEPC